MLISRDSYVDMLFKSRHNGFIKVITGMRRCGKSFLLFELFRKRLLESGVDEGQIISLAFDSAEGRNICDAIGLCSFLESRMTNDIQYYVLLDEIQILSGFEAALNQMLYHRNVDLYVTGSNSRFLSIDVITEFRGRGQNVHVYPLSFAEYLPAHGGSERLAWNDYVRFGGLPQVLSFDTAADKSEYLKSLFREVYLLDIIERNKIQDDRKLVALMNVLASSVGSLVSLGKLSRAFASAGRGKLSIPTMDLYCSYLRNAFLVESAMRFDVKGKRYLSTPYKIYFEDTGIRNAQLNFRQTEPNHLMENIIYTELRRRRLDVDVGMISCAEKDSDGKSVRKQLEVDFVASSGDRRYYIQSAYALSDEDKLKQEMHSLDKLKDSFEKIVVTGNDTVPWRNDRGYRFVGIIDFLLDRSLTE